METATAFHALDDLLADIMARVTDTGKPPSVVIDEMGPIRLRPEDQRTAIREGLISLANDRQGMRGLRSGKFQSNPGRVKPLALEEETIAEYHDRILSRLIYQAADGTMRSVLTFTADDVAAAYERRVRRPREQAEREEPFWTAMADVTKSGWTLERRADEVRARLARLAVSQGLTKNGDSEE